MDWACSADAQTTRQNEARNNLGVALSDKGYLAEAAATYRQVLSTKPNSFETHNNLGVLLWDAGRLEEAEAELRIGIELGDDIARRNLDGLQAERGHRNGHT